MVRQTGNPVLENGHGPGKHPRHTLHASRSNHQGSDGNIGNSPLPPSSAYLPMVASNPGHCPGSFWVNKTV
jgi:hypothetical protein